MKMTREEPLLLSTHDKWSLNGLGINWIGSLAVEHYGGYNTIVVKSCYYMLPQKWFEVISQNE